MLAYLGTMFSFVELSWAYAGFCWVVFGLSWDYFASPGLLRAYVYFILDLRWTILGLCWDYVERRKDIKVQRNQFFTVFAVFFTYSTF